MTEVLSKDKLRHAQNLLLLMIIGKYLGEDDEALRTAVSAIDYCLAENFPK